MIISLSQLNMLSSMKGTRQVSGHNEQHSWKNVSQRTRKEGNQRSDPDLVMFVFKPYWGFQTTTSFRGNVAQLSEKNHSQVSGSKKSQIFFFLFVWNTWSGLLVSGLDAQWPSGSLRPMLGSRHWGSGLLVDTKLQPRAEAPKQQFLKCLLEADTWSHVQMAFKELIFF